MLKRWPIVLIAVAAASCNVPRGNNVSADEADGSAANLTVPEANVAESNDAASNSVGNASAGNASAASGAGHASADSGAAYQAVGAEPNWSLTFSGRRMRYEPDPDEGAPVSEQLPARIPIPNGYRYAGARITVEVVHRTCRQVGNQTYPDEVKVTVGGRTLQGCGGGRSGERG